ncbi:hypothetical protein C2L65_36735 [Paraburkholderia terrae]|uniref:Uncharacterized protein n=1 Tax=Paraburkholderia terrae TaxID=311230 RepID=A0A2I8F069_9BURK|nr:hypothetical protein C2L65_36735 [Paraburkholderia terrae]
MRGGTYFWLSATLDGLLVFFFGIRVTLACFRRRPCAGRQLLLVVCDAGWFACVLFWHPRFAFVLQALPLCGAAPTFLCRRKEK